MVAKQEAWKELSVGLNDDHYAFLITELDSVTIINPLGEAMIKDIAKDRIARALAWRLEADAAVAAHVTT